MSVLGERRHFAQEPSVEPDVLVDARNLPSEPEPSLLESHYANGEYRPHDPSRPGLGGMRRALEGSFY